MLRGVSIRAATRVGGVLALLAAGALSPASAGATVTFGADLSLTPDHAFTCPNPPFFHPYVYPDTCTAFTSGVFGGGNVRGTQLVPDGQGEITKLRLREPNTPSSPLKLTVLRALRTPQSSVSTCCTVVSESAAFTPLANAITEVTFNPPIPVHAITTATGVYEYEALALTATDAGSLIPAATATGHGSGAYYPAAVPGQERYEGTVSLGTDIQILFEADWEPVDTAGGTGGGGGGGPVVPPIVGPVPIAPATPVYGATKPVTVGSGLIAGHVATLPLACRQATACRGTLRLQSRTPATRAATAKKPALYGSATFSVPAGRTAQIRVKLTRAGKKLIAKHASVTLYAQTTIGTQVTSTKVTLRAKKAKKKHAS